MEDDGAFWMNAVDFVRHFDEVSQDFTRIHLIPSIHTLKMLYPSNPATASLTGRETLEAFATSVSNYLRLFHVVAVIQLCS